MHERHKHLEWHRPSDEQFDEMGQLRAWCSFHGLLAEAVNPASPDYPKLQCMLVFNSPKNRPDIHGTAVLVLPRVTAGRMPKGGISTWVMGLRQTMWDVIAARGADKAIERLSDSGYG